MCLSTMAAAGLGNTISDVVGLGSAVYVERLCEVMGFKVPPLSKFQMEMKESRRSASFVSHVYLIILSTKLKKQARMQV